MTKTNATTADHNLAARNVILADRLEQRERQADADKRRRAEEREPSYAEAMAASYDY